MRASRDCTIVDGSRPTAKWPMTIPATEPTAPPRNPTKAASASMSPTIVRRLPPSARIVEIDGPALGDRDTHRVVAQKSRHHQRDRGGKQRHGLQNGERTACLCGPKARRGHDRPSTDRRGHRGPDLLDVRVWRGEDQHRVEPPLAARDPLCQREWRDDEVCVVQPPRGGAVHHRDGGDPRRPDVDLSALGNAKSATDDHAVGRARHRRTRVELVLDRRLQVRMQLGCVLTEPEHQGLRRVHRHPDPHHRHCRGDVLDTGDALEQRLVEAVVGDAGDLEIGITADAGGQSVDGAGDRTGHAEHRDEQRGGHRDHGHRGQRASPMGPQFADVEQPQAAEPCGKHCATTGMPRDGRRRPSPPARRCPARRGAPNRSGPSADRRVGRPSACRARATPR